MASSTGAKARADADPIRAFFEDLANAGHQPLLQSASGTLRFDLVEGGRKAHWFVTIDRGDVTVSHKETKADSVVRADKQLFERMVTGRVNAMAAVLRGEIVPEGNFGLLIAFQRLFPSPPRPRRRSGPTSKGSPR